MRVRVLSFVSFYVRFYSTRGALDPSRWSVWLPQYGVFSSSRWLSYFSSIGQTEETESERQREAQQQETDRLARHYETTVAAADEYNTELLQLVAEKIYEADGLEEFIKVETHTQEEEANKANKLKTLSFARFIVAIWSVPLTFLLCRLMFCIYGRVVYLSNVAAAIHTTRSSAYLGGGRMQCPPLFDASYQRRLLRTFKSITPDAICRIFFRMVSQVVAKHVDHISYSEETSENDMYALLSTINSEIEVKIASQSGEFWKSLLGNRDVVTSEEFGYVNDVMKEARKIVGMRSWHVLVVDSVKRIVRKQTPFLRDAYKSVMEALRSPNQSEAEEEEESQYSESEEDGSEVDARLPYCTKMPNQLETNTVMFDDNESQASANSAYDISQSPSVFYTASRDARRLSPDPRFSPYPDRSRLVAEGSLEPLELSEAEEPVLFDAENSNAKEEGPMSDSEKDTGDHQSFRSTRLNFGRRSPSRGMSGSCGPALPPPHPQRASPKLKQAGMNLEVNGIHFIRWATKLGKRAKDIFGEEADTVEEVKAFLSTQSFFLDVFASEPVTTLPRCQEEIAPRYYNRC
eukprot:g4930.t1